MEINRRPQIGLILLFIAFVLSGCAGAIGLIPSAVQLGAQAAASIEDTDVDSAVSPGITKEDFEKIKKIAVIFDKPQQQQMMNPYQSGDLTSAIADSFTLELMKLGFDVIERQQLTTIIKEQELQLSGLTREKLLEVGQVFGVNAVVTGSVTGSQSMSTGFMGSNIKMTSLVQNASLKIIGAENARTMMIVTINYKKGQKPNDAAKTIAEILKLKLEDPFGEVGKEKS